jgi:uncharacterized protein DUF4154
MLHRRRTTTGSRGVALWVVARLALVAALVFGGAWHRSEAQEDAYSEAEVKAAFLYHFGTYVQWPSAARAEGPITIAVLGADAVVTQLEAFLPGRRIAGRSVEVRSLDRIQDLRDEELLFIGGEHNGELGELIEVVGQRPVLVVTDAADGLARGAMVNFQLVDRRVRFEISLPKAEGAGLTLSSRLLSAALRVQTSSSWFDGYPYFHRYLGLAVVRLAA